MTQRRAGAVQGWVLISGSWLATAVAGALAPSLPKMAAAFANLPAIDLKISLVATLPALFIALFAIPFGFLADKVGRRRVLLGGATAYGLAGTAPLWLPSLESIIVARALIGIAEAAIMTSATAMIADYFDGKSRERWLALQTATATLFAIVTAGVGGVLGDHGWRTPFIVYGFAFVLAPLVWFLTWTPTPHVSDTGTQNIAQPVARFSWWPLLRITAVNAFAQSAFFLPIIQLSFLLTERGIVEPSKIGMWSALAALANPIGSLLFVVTRMTTRSRLFASFLLYSIGFAVMSLLPTYQAVIGGALIANVGAGFMFPTMVTWALSTLPAAQRSRGTGLYMTGAYVGQFSSPLIVLFLAQQTGNRSHAITIYAAACALAALMSLTKREQRVTR